MMRASSVYVAVMFLGACSIDAPTYVAPTNDAAGDADARPDAPEIDGPTPDGAVGPCGARVIFRAGGSGQGEIYTANPDGSGLTNLSDDAAEDAEPTWSPAPGGQIAFESKRDGNSEIYVVNPNGTGLTNLTSDTAEDYRPRFSPDGSLIAWTRGNRLWVMNADGSVPRQLGTLTVTATAAISWAPDSARIAVTAGNDIQVVSVAGGVTNLTNDSSSVLDSAPSWSPDGDLIAFTSQSGSNSDIHTMTPTGDERTNRTVNAAADGQASWSPDSTQFAFFTERDGNSEIYVMSLAGATTRITNDSGTDRIPRWSPDGAKLAFTRTTPGPVSDIVTVNVDGSMEATFSPTTIAGQVSWSPCLD